MPAVFAFFSLPENLIGVMAGMLAAATPSVGTKSLSTMDVALDRGCRWHPRSDATEGTVMRAHHVIAIVAVILVGVGVKLTFFAAPTAEAESLSVKSVSLDISQMHQNTKNLPVQKLHDMSFVFYAGD